MADLKTFSGFPVQNLSSDSTSVGQIYYNTSSGSFKAVTTGVGSWASGASFTAGYSGRGAAGPTNASIFFGGLGPANNPGAVSSNTELYNGTAWTETANLNTASMMFCPAKQGTQTAALAASGSIVSADLAKNELWNGSSWTEVGDLNGTHSYADGAGTSTASLAIGRGPQPRAFVESWNGSSWTETGDLNTGRYFNSAAGTQTAALTFSGDVDNTFTANTESWNGSAWTEVNNLNTLRATGGGFGTQTSALMATGNIPSPTSTNKANTEQWDGTSWTEVADVATARTRPGSTGASGAEGILGGGLDVGTTSVEEWSISAFEVKTLTTS